MRKIIALAVVAGIVSATAALAVPPSGTPGHSNAPAVSPASTHKPLPHPVQFVFRGVLTSDATAAGVQLDVKSANHHARKALAGATSVSLKLDASSIIRKAGKHPATFADLNAGDRVMLQLRAARSTALSSLPALKRIVDVGPKPVKSSGA
jgi:hypothetical protein